MSYFLVGYDTEKSIFVSHKGKEESVSFKPEENCEYYLSDETDFVIKFLDGWKDDLDLIGEVLSKTGELLFNIPHPGKSHGKLSTSGIVSGDSSGFKFIVVPYGNSSEYFMWFRFSDKKFRGAGNIVR